MEKGKRVKTPSAWHLGIQEYRFSNGLRALFFQDASKPTFTLNLTVFAGSIHEGPGEAGMAHVFEHLLFRGLKGYPDLKQTFTDLGAEYNGNTYFERTCFYETLPSGDGNLAAAIRIEAARLGRALLREEDLAKERKIVEQEFQLRASNPVTLLLQGLLGTMFSYHPYGREPIGTIKDFTALRMPAIKGFYERFYTPDNAVLILTGGFDVEKAIGLIERHFGKLPKSRRPRPAKPSEEPGSVGERRFAVRGQGDARYLMVSYRVPGAFTRGGLAGTVLGAMLVSGSVGILHDRVVAKGLASSVHAFPFMGSMPSPFMIYALVPKDKDPGDAEAAICEVMERTSFVEEALARAKNMVEQSYDDIWNEPRTMAQVLTEFEATGSWKLLLIRREEAKSITLAEVQAFAAKYFRPENRVVGTFIPDAETKAVEMEPVRTSKDYAELLGRLPRDIKRASGFSYTPRVLQEALRWLDVGPARIGHIRKQVAGDDVIVHFKIPFGGRSLVAPVATEGSLLASLLGDRTRTLSKEDVKNVLAGKGAHFTVSSCHDRSGAIISIFAKKQTLGELGRLFSEMIRTPFIEESQLRDCVAKQEGQIKSIRDNPQMALSHLANRMTYPPGDPRRLMSIEENLDKLKTVTIQSLLAFHREFYGPEGILGSAVGDVTSEEVALFLEGLVAPGWSAARPAKSEPDMAVASLYKTEDTFATPGKPIVISMLGQPMRLRQSDPDFIPMDVGALALSGDALNSRIAKKVRGQEALCYAIQGTFHAALHGDFATHGAIVITSPENARKAVDLVRAELEAAQEGNFTEDEIRNFRDSYATKLAISRADDGMIAASVLELAQAGMDFDLWARQDAELATLTAGKVNEAFRRHLDCSKLGLLQVGDLPVAETVK